MSVRLLDPNVLLLLSEHLSIFDRCHFTVYLLFLYALLARDEKYITTTSRTAIMPGRIFLSEPELDRHSVFYALISGTTYFYSIFI